jgi:pyruvate dehydrogenase E2 component (dihydrolipoamide acetyltransferase)
VPHLELTASVEMSASMSIARDSGCSLDALLVRACALALAEHPRANGTYRDARFELHSRVNVGLQLETGDAYVIATVLDADTKSLQELTAEVERLSDAARAEQLTPPELSGATFTIWNAGPYGLATAQAIVSPPAAAAVAAGTVRELPIIRDGAIVPGRSMNLTLTCDHRILFGPDAARFLNRISSLLEEGTL